MHWVKPELLAGFEKLAALIRGFGLTGLETRLVHAGTISDDARGITAAYAMLQTYPYTSAIEIWDGARMVARVTRKTTTEPTWVQLVGLPAVAITPDATGIGSEAA
jgi:hypothetical protein